MGDIPSFRENSEGFPHSGNYIAERTRSEIPGNGQRTTRHGSAAHPQAGRRAAHQGTQR